MQGAIHLSEALQQMRFIDENGKNKPFHVKFVTYNRTKNIGGEIIDLPAVQIVSTAKDNKPIFLPPVQANERSTGKNPNHYSNNTVNFFIPSSGQIRKAHVRLILEFNNQKVYF